MDLIRTREGFDAALRRAEFQHLLALMVEHGLPVEAAAKTCVDLAELAHSVEVAPQLQPYVDVVARQYEDIANSMLGGSLLPRDPT